MALNLALAISWPARAPADEPASEPVIAKEAELAASAIRVPAGYRVAPVASEPNLANPVAFCFDPEGRIYAAETYRVNKGVEDNRHHPDWLDDDLAARTVAERRAYTIKRMGDNIHLYTEASDQVRMLEDRDGDGRYEHSSVFSTGYDDVEEGIGAGLLWDEDRLLFTCIPSLWELRDADANGQAEHKRALTTGYGVHFAFFGHDLHGLCHGPDGKIYFSVGDRGLHVETPEGVVSNPDSGAILRCNPNGSKLELVATGLRNPQELAFNAAGDLFTVDNNSDSGDRARLVHVVEGMDAGWRMSYQYLPDRGPFNREKIWHPQNSEQPASIVPPLANLTDGPSGLAYDPGTGMQSGQGGAFFICDFRGSPGNSGVRQFSVKPKGATYELDRESWFAENVLATDCDFGPDGAFYICDWIEGWGELGKGRIHRVVSDDPAATSERAASEQALRAVPEMGRDELLRSLNNDHMGVRLAAQRRLVAGGAASAPQLVRLATSAEESPRARIHAIWALGALGEADAKLFDALARLCAGNDDGDVRAQAAKTLGRAEGATDEQRRACGSSLIPMLADPSPRLRSFAAISVGKLQHQPALAALLQVVRDNNDHDPALRHAAVMGLAGSQTDEALAAAAHGATATERLSLLLALGRQRSPFVAQFLDDQAEPVALEAARIIWDSPLPEAYDELAGILRQVPASNEPLLRRALAANVAVGGVANLQGVIECGLRDDLSPAMREHAWQIVRAWSSPSPRDPVHGLWRPLAPRPAEELLAALRVALPQILEASAVDATGLVVAAEVGLQKAYLPLLKLVESGAPSQELQSRAVAALASADETIAEQVIEAGLKSSHAAVRSASRELLVRRFPAQAVAQLREVLESATISEQQSALDLLAQLDAPDARAVIGQWMEKVENGSCPPHLLLEVIEAAAKCSDPAVTQRQEKYSAKVLAANPLAQFSSCLEGGDAARGKRAFEENAALSCRRCHATTPGEQIVGPNLSGVALQRSREELVESIVNPNAKITEGFQTTVLQLDTGEVVSGILRPENDSHATLIDSEGKKLPIELATVEDRFEGKSAMPEKLADLMTRRELRDVIEYLSTLREPAPAPPVK